jgi:glycine cleavage system aminomethyltransferase T
VFEGLQQDYRHLCEHVQLWDVACERQVEINGPDATRLVELITPRDLSRCAVGQGMYAPLCDEHGGIVNDPIALKLADDRYWLSIADSDVRLWVAGIAWGRGYDVRVFEPDVSPLALQGPKADDLMSDILGPQVRDIRFFHFIDTEIAGINVILQRSGWSGQGGFEVYLQDSAMALALWDYLWSAGERHRIRVGGPNQIDRMEAGLKSWGSDMTQDSNPLEAGLQRFLDLDKQAEYMSRAALAEIAARGPARKLVNLVIDGAPLRGLRNTWPLSEASGTGAGIVTSQVWSPRFGKTIAFGIVASNCAGIGTQLTLDIDGAPRAARVHDEKWQLT